MLKKFYTQFIHLSLLLIFLPLLNYVHANEPIYEITEQKCQPVNSFFCNINNYLTIQPFNNSFGHTKLNDAIAELHKHAILLKLEPCRSKIQLFLCSLYTPVCVKPLFDQQFLPPCRDVCEEARQYCSAGLDRINGIGWPEEWSCEKFPLYRDNHMCVINNSKEPQSTTQTPFGSDNETMCDQDLFDCRLSDPSRGRKAFCIDANWVCDGKKDCVIDGESNEESLDEVNCQRKCLDGELFCDGKCIGSHDICNGKVDCSSGADEKDCSISINIVQVVVCVFALCFITLCIILKVVLMRKDQCTLSEANIKESIDEHPPIQPCIISDLNHTDPIYHEPSYAYERLNIGGHSGASSVYAAAYGIYHPDLHRSEILNDIDSIHRGEARELPLPVAPPPTPAPE